MDYDELLVPHYSTAPTYSQLLEFLDKEHPDAAFYRFSNVFFVPSPAVSDTSEEHKEFLIALRMSRHLPPTPNGSRTKCIYKPHRVSQVYTHFGTPLNSSYSEVIVPPEICALHHYRRHLPEGAHTSVQTDDFTVRDNYASRIKDSSVYRAMEKVLVMDPSITRQHQ